MSAPSWHRSDNPAVYNANASFVYSAAATAPVLALLDLQAGERILDLGCGSGELTAQLGAELAQSGGSVVAVDVAQSMLDAAKRFETDNIRWHCVDGQQLEPWLDAQGEREAFDRVFSNAAVSGHEPLRCQCSLLTLLADALDEPRPRGRGARRLCGAQEWRHLCSRVSRPHTISDSSVLTRRRRLGGFGCATGVRGGMHAALRRRGVDPTLHDPWCVYSSGLDERNLICIRQVLPDGPCLCRDPARRRLHHRLHRPRAAPDQGAVGRARLAEGARAVRDALLPFAPWLITMAQTFGGPFLAPLADDAEREAAVAEVEELLRPDSYDADRDEWTVM
jgi:SAM-dependent methyltransferase